MLAPMISKRSIPPLTSANMEPAGVGLGVAAIESVLVGEGPVMVVGPEVSAGVGRVAVASTGGAVGGAAVVGGGSVCAPAGNKGNDPTHNNANINSPPMITRLDNGFIIAPSTRIFAPAPAGSRNCWGKFIEKIHLYQY
jgi:hypothetical protein